MSLRDRIAKAVDAAAERALDRATEEKVVDAGGATMRVMKPGSTYVIVPGGGK